jgi:3-oxoacyl-[acyl-carrier-protein] synthase II
MAVTARRAVFTGAGVLSSVGCDLGTFWNSLRDRKCGIISWPFPDLKSQLFGHISDFQPRKILTNKEHIKSLKLMARTVQLGLCSSHLAFNDSKLEIGKFDATRAGVEYGAGMIATELDDLAAATRTSLDESTGQVSIAKWGAQKDVGMSQIFPLWMLKYLPNMPACHVSITLDLRGPSNTQTNSDCASLLALGEAFHNIERDRADLFVCGGAESKMNPLSQTRHNLFQDLSTLNDAPLTSHRPFDRDRKGAVLGEASGSIVLEEAEHALRRGAKISAELASFACGFDRARNGEVMAKVLRKALSEAGITAADVDHVNAQGLATAKSDRWEARAINEVFGPKTPVWAMKGNIGSSGAASSLVELVGSLLALEHGELPPTINCDNRDPECPIHVHTDGLRPVTKPYAVKLSFTDMGQVAVAVLKKWDA